MKKRTLYLITLLTIFCINQKLLSQNKNIEITYKRNTDKTVDISYTKKLPGSYYLKLEFSNLKNCYESNIERVIKSGSGSLIKLRPINSKQQVTFSYKYSTIRGNPNPKVDSLFNYVIPFKKGKKVRINEASNVDEKYFGNDRPTNWKSYIIYRKSPDTICSMRKGVVVQIINKFNADTLFNKSFTSKRNKIIIEHSDGTYASYTGFKKNSTFVKLGQTVYPQTKLGILEIFNAGKYRLSFAIYYLDDSNLKKLKNKSLKNKKSRNAFLTPYFITENGSEKIKPRNEYTTTSNEKILFEEFTKREKKKYKKNQLIFD